jgi:hypothetical protein
MKLILIACVFATSLAGCVVIPVGYRYHNDGYDHYERGYSRSYGDNHDPDVRSG